MKSIFGFVPPGPGAPSIFGFVPPFGFVLPGPGAPFTGSGIILSKTTYAATSPCLISNLGSGLAARSDLAWHSDHGQLLTCAYMCFDYGMSNVENNKNQKQKIFLCRMSNVESKAQRNSPW